MDVPSCPIVGHEYEPATGCRACAAERLADTEADTAPMRPAEAPEQIREVAERHRTMQTRGSKPGRDFAQPHGLSPIADGVSTCGRPGCGGRYVDDQAAREAHLTVFGHLPEPFPEART